MAAAVRRPKSCLHEKRHTTRRKLRWQKQIVRIFARETRHCCRLQWRRRRWFACRWWRRRISAGQGERETQHDDAVANARARETRQSCASATAAAATNAAENYAISICLSLSPFVPPAHLCTRLSEHSYAQPGDSVPDSGGRGGSMRFEAGPPEGATTTLTFLLLHLIVVVVVDLRFCSRLRLVCVHVL